MASRNDKPYIAPVKKCETFGCHNSGVRLYSIAPGTSVWLCERCIKEEETMHPSGVNEEANTRLLDSAPDLFTLVLEQLHPPFFENGREVREWQEKWAERAKAIIQRIESP